MLLNRDEIAKKNILKAGSFDSSQFCDSIYNLRIGTFIPLNTDNDQKECTSFILQPRGMVVAVTEEEFDMPHDVIGISTLKNELSVKGVMAINVGLIDPKYKGPISTALINFGKAPIRLQTKDTILRVIFQQFNPPSKSLNKSLSYTKEKYIRDRANSALTYLDSTFLNMNAIQSDLEQRVKEELASTLKEYDDSKTREYTRQTQRVTRWAFFIAGLGILLAALNAFYFNKKENTDLQLRLSFLETTIKANNVSNLHDTIQVHDTVYVPNIKDGSQKKGTSPISKD